MKAFLLGAGLGTRLRPFTNSIPKCLLPIGGQPLLQVWLELLQRHGVTEVTLNTSHLADQVRDFATGWSGLPRLYLSHEDVLLGSAGTLERNWDFVKDEESFLVCYADNLTDIDISEMIRVHQGNSGLVTMALFRSQNPRECGIAEVADNGAILSFEEKPQSPKSSLANGGIYVMRTDIQSRLPLKKPADIGFDLLPQCVGQMYGWLWEGLLVDIGSPESYLKAQELWASSVLGAERTG